MVQGVGYKVQGIQRILDGEVLQGGYTVRYRGRLSVSQVEAQKLKPLTSEFKLPAQTKN